MASIEAPMNRPKDKIDVMELEKIRRIREEGN